jgi:hypothetical protein
LKFAQEQDSSLLPARMPAVEPLDDPDGFFGGVRRGFTELPAEKPHFVLITPERKIAWIPAPSPGSVARSDVKDIHAILPSNRSLRISVIASTISGVSDEISLKELSDAIPFLGYLFGFATAGHNVIVFEGHPDIFEPGVRWSDVLLIDSGMLPFLQRDWFEVATRVMTPGARILLHDRERYEQHHVLGKNGEAAEQVHTIAAESGGELSYVNCLLTIMRRGGPSSVEIASGEPLPDLAAMEPDPEIRPWVSTLPFRHGTLDPDLVMSFILQLAGRRWFHVFRSSWLIKVKVATSGGLLNACFSVSLTKLGRRQRKLLVERCLAGETPTVPG